MSFEELSDEPRAPFRPVETALSETQRTLELREEQLVAHKELVEIGEISVRTELDQVSGRLEVDAQREEIVVEHEPVGQIVSAREEPSEQNGVLVLPVYEEQLVVSKRLILKERLHVRRVTATERVLFEDTLLRERLVIEDPQHTGHVREQYPTGEPSDARLSSPSDEGEPADTDDKDEGGLLQHLVRKALG
jgi:uncharacterized protein (TIGR02271 family)